LLQYAQGAISGLKINADLERYFRNLILISESWGYGLKSASQVMLLFFFFFGVQIMVAHANGKIETSILFVHLFLICSLLSE
jgi:hypothetical protein